jgi:hypothetical protein
MNVEDEMEVVREMIVMAYAQGDEAAARKHSGKLSALYNERDGFFRGWRNFRKALQTTVVEAERLRTQLYYEQCSRERGSFEPEPFWEPWRPASPAAFTPEECAIHEAHRHIRDMSELPAGRCPVCGARNRADAAKEFGLTGSETLHDILERFTKK